MSVSTYTMTDYSNITAQKPVIPNLNVFQDMDLAHVALHAISQGGLGPVVKNELRTSIQTKRIASGQEEIEVEYKPVEPEELTPEDLHRRQRRRETNRIAARKCREKRRQRTEELLKETQSLESRNTELRRQVTKLENEKKTLYELIRKHSPTCFAQLPSILATKN